MNFIAVFAMLSIALGSGTASAEVDTVRRPLHLSWSALSIPCCPVASPLLPLLTFPAPALNFSRQVGSPADDVRGTAAGGIPKLFAPGTAEEAAGLFPLFSDNKVRSCSYYSSVENMYTPRPWHG